MERVEAAATPKTELRLIKFQNGEEIIAEVLGTDDKTPNLLAIDTTLSINYEVNPQTGKVGFNFLPWGPMVDGPKFVNLGHILYIAKPTDQLKQAFNQITGRIVTPSKDIVIA